MHIRPTGKPLWVHAENIFNEDPPGVTWDEVGGVAPLGGFSAIATYNGEIELEIVRDLWVVDLYSNPPLPVGPLVPFDPAHARIRTGITIVGGVDLRLLFPSPARLLWARCSPSPLVARSSEGDSPPALPEFPPPGASAAAILGLALRRAVS